MRVHRADVAHAMSAAEFLARGLLLALIVWALAHVWVSCGKDCSGATVKQTRGTK